MLIPLPGLRNSQIPNPFHYDIHRFTQHHSIQIIAFKPFLLYFILIVNQF